MLPVLCLTDSSTNSYSAAYLQFIYKSFTNYLQITYNTVDPAYIYHPVKRRGRSGNEFAKAYLMTVRYVRVTEGNGCNCMLWRALIHRYRVARNRLLDQHGAYPVDHHTWAPGQGVEVNTMKLSEAGKAPPPLMLQNALKSRVGKKRIKISRNQTPHAEADKSISAVVALRSSHITSGSDGDFKISHKINSLKSLPWLLAV